jgi:hypothetical protein
MLYKPKKLTTCFPALLVEFQGGGTTVALPFGHVYLVLTRA